MEIVLQIDDETFVLNSVEPLFADTGMHILKAGNGQEAIEILKRESVAVPVPDSSIPGMKGTDLVQLVKTISPDTVKIMMTAVADLPTTIEAINIGEVFRFVVKPWDAQMLPDSAEKGAACSGLLHALRKGDEAILRFLTRIMELKDPYTRGHCERVAQYALMLAEALELPTEMLEEIRYGSWLHDCGKIGVPETILNFPGKLEQEGFTTVKRHPVWGAEVARQAQLPPTVINIIQHHHEHYDGSGYPVGVAGTDIPLEARIVTIADIYDALTTNRPYRSAYSEGKCLEMMACMRGRIVDPELSDIFFTQLTAKVTVISGSHLPPVCAG